MNDAVVRPGAATSGIWTRFISASTAGVFTSGAPWIRTVSVLDNRIQPRHNQRAALRFFRKLIKGLRYVPRVIITDPLKTDQVTRKERIPGVEHASTQG